MNRTELSRLRNSFLRLGLTAESVLAVPQITPLIARLNWRPVPRTEKEIAAALDTPELTGRDLAISLLRSSDSEDARKFFAVYDSPTLRASDRRNLPLEALALAAGVPTPRLLAVIVEAATREGTDQSRMIVGLNAPAVMRETVSRALDPDNKDSNKYVAMFHKMSGAMPTPKGSTTIITTTANAQSASQSSAQAVSAPPPEQTIRRLVDRFNDRTLPAASTAPVLVEVNPHDELGEPEVMLPEREPSLAPVSAFTHSDAMRSRFADGDE